METSDNKQRAKSGIKARQDAIKWLIEQNRAAFDAKVEENRVALGLTRKPLGDSPNEIRAKMARSEERMRKWREQLEQAEADEASRAS